MYKHGDVYILVLGIYMVYTWYIHGIYMVSTWYMPCIIFLLVPDDGGRWKSSPAT